MSGATICPEKARHRAAPGANEVIWRDAPADLSCTTAIALLLLQQQSGHGGRR